jgi:hypothetical protein
MRLATQQSASEMLVGKSKNHGRRLVCEFWERIVHEGPCGTKTPVHAIAAFCQRGEIAQFPGKFDVGRSKAGVDRTLPGADVLAETAPADASYNGRR